MPARVAWLPLVAALSLTACSTSNDAEPNAGSSPATTPAVTASASATADSGSPSPSASPEPTATVPDGPTLSVRLRGDQIAPNGQRIELGLGEPLIIAFDSDRAGQLHVHSKPDQVVKFAAGKSTQRLVIETPGVVEVEEHETGYVVAQLEVR